MCLLGSGGVGLAGFREASRPPSCPLLVPCSFASHPKYVALLREAYAQAPHEFYESFVHETSRLLLIYKREMAVERLVDFISLFAEAVPGWNEEFALGLLQYVGGRAVSFVCSSDCCCCCCCC
jgi:hypothetical protein